MRHVATGLDRPFDVEECQGGWLVASWGSHIIDFAGGDVNGGVGGAMLGTRGSGHGEFKDPSALALPVPVVAGLGLVVREWSNGSRLQFFATPDTIAMASMSAARVGWIGAVARGAAHRALIAARHRQPAGPTGKRGRQGQRGSGV